MIFSTILIIALGAVVLRVMVRVVTVWSRKKALAALAKWAQAEALELVSVKSPLFLPISQSGPGCQFFQVVLKDGRGALLRAWIRFPDFGSEGLWNLKVTWDTEPETRLSKQQRIRLAASVATVLVVVCAAIMYSTGPYYHGKSLRTWAQMPGRLDVDATRFECGWGEEDENWNRAGQNAEAADAIRHLGSRSFSRLVHAIKAQESPWKSKLTKEKATNPVRATLPPWPCGISVPKRLPRLVMSSPGQNAMVTNRLQIPPGKQSRKIKRYSFSKEDGCSRIDFLLLSRGMALEWLSNESSVLTLPNWGLASEHRPIVVAFRDFDL